MNSVPAVFDQSPISHTSPSDSLRLIRASIQLAASRHHLYVTPIHLFVSLWSLSEPEARQFLLDQDMDPDVVILGLEELLQELPTTTSASTTDTLSADQHPSSVSNSKLKPSSSSAHTKPTNRRKSGRRGISTGFSRCDFNANSIYSTNNGIYKKVSPASLYRQYLRQQHQQKQLYNDIACSTTSATPRLSDSMNWFVQQLQILAVTSDYKFDHYTELWNLAIEDSTLNSLNIDLHDLLQTARSVYDDDDGLLCC